MQETVWRGTPAERQRLLASVARNCACDTEPVTPRPTLCSVHRAVVFDQSFLDRLIYAAGCVNVSCARNGSLTTGMPRRDRLMQLLRDLSVAVGGPPALLDGVRITNSGSLPSVYRVFHLTAVTAAGHATFVPDITTAGDWDFTLSVTGPAGPAISPPQKLGIDPHRPQVSLTYRLSQIAIPFVTVIVLLGFFRLRHIDLERWPIRGMQAQMDPGHERRSVVG
jgi:hypothetical protein